MDFATALHGLSLKCYTVSLSIAGNTSQQCTVRLGLNDGFADGAVLTNALLRASAVGNNVRSTQKERVNYLGGAL